MKSCGGKKDVIDGETLDDEISLQELESGEICVYAAADIIVSDPFSKLCASLKTSKVTALDLCKCGLSSQDMAELAEYVRDASAALARVDIRGADVEEAVLETLRAAAPEGCEVVW
eukprot:COSAG01_NODE_13954_length_1514_cov_54.648057_1_plen_115_part_10